MVKKTCLIISIPTIISVQLTRGDPRGRSAGQASSDRFTVTKFHNSFALLGAPSKLGAPQGGGVAFPVSNFGLPDSPFPSLDSQIRSPFQTFSWSHLPVSLANISTPIAAVSENTAWSLLSEANPRF
jgi:hypothetical protein